MNCSSRDVKSHPLSSIDKNSSVKTISSQNTASRSKLEITHTEGESFENKKNFSLKLSKSPGKLPQYTVKEIIFARKNQQVFCQYKPILLIYFLDL